MRTWSRDNKVLNKNNLHLEHVIFESYRFQSKHIFADNDSTEVENLKFVVLMESNSNNKISLHVQHIVLYTKTFTTN